MSCFDIVQLLEVLGGKGYMQAENIALSPFTYCKRKTTIANSNIHFHMNSLIGCAFEIDLSGKIGLVSRIEIDCC